MKTLFPLISVIVPSYNAANSIGVALHSLQKQTYQNLEIIVVDDKSTDSTRNVVENIIKTDSRVKYFVLPNDDPHRFNERGRNINAGYAARNYGFEKIQGEWVTFQDADDASLLNRIEAQYELAKKYNATHVCIDWQQLTPARLEKKLDFIKILSDHPETVVSPQELTFLAKKTKGSIIPLIGSLNKHIPFEWKRLRIINKIFFGSLDPYPGTGNSPLFKREVVERVKFRPLAERIWPSFMGRGADRDFNFQVAETFQNSYTFLIPLYLWRQKSQNARYTDYGQYLY